MDYERQKNTIDVKYHSEHPATSCKDTEIIKISFEILTCPERNVLGIKWINNILESEMKIGKYEPMLE